MKQVQKKIPGMFLTARANVFTSKLTALFVLTGFLMAQSQLAFADGQAPTPFTPGSQDGAPLTTITEDVIKDADARRLLEQEEEKKREEQRKDDALLNKESPLSEVRPTDDDARDKKSVEDSNTEQVVTDMQAAAALIVQSKEALAKEIEKSSAKVHTPSKPATLLLPFYETSKREEEKKQNALEALKELIQETKRDKDRDRKKEESAPRPKVSERDSLTGLIGPIAAAAERYFLSNTALTLQDVAPSAMTAASQRMFTSSDESRQIDRQLAGAVTGFAPVESFQKSPLLSMNPEMYISTATSIRNAIISLISSLALSTNHAGLIGFVQTKFSGALGPLNDQLVTQALVQAADLDRMIYAMSTEHQALAEATAEEAAVVSRFLKAVASAQSDLTESAIAEIMERTKPMSLEIDDYLQGDSLVLYVQNQFLAWHEIQTRTSERLEAMEMMRGKPDLSTDELKNMLRETTAMLITAQLWKDLAVTARERLERIFDTLSDSRKRLEASLSRLATIRSHVAFRTIENIRTEEKHLYHVSIKIDDLYRATEDLNVLRTEFVAKTEVERARIDAGVHALDGVRLDMLPEETRTAVLSLTERVKKVAADQTTVPSGTAIEWNADRLNAILKQASEIELAASGAVSPSESLLDLYGQMSVLSTEVTDLAANMLAEANRMETEVRNAQMLWKGSEQRALIIGGYLSEIQNLLDHHTGMRWTLPEPVV